MTSRTILIVDDDNDLREMLAEQLSLYEEFEVLQEATAGKGVQTVRGGISADKREGDGATPLATMRLVCGFFRRGSFQARSSLPLKPIGPSLGWCEVPDDRNYNRPVKMPYRASHERMLREDGLYDACIVLDWNLRPRRRGRGSAIFFHLARPGYTPTQGCVAVGRAVMARLLPRLSRATALKVTR